MVDEYFWCLWALKVNEISYSSNLPIVNGIVVHQGIGDIGNKKISNKSW